MPFKCMLFENPFMTINTSEEEICMVLDKSHDCHMMTLHDTIGACLFKLVISYLCELGPLFLFMLIKLSLYNYAVFIIADILVAIKHTCLELTVHLCGYTFFCQQK